MMVGVLLLLALAATGAVLGHAIDKLNDRVARIERRLSLGGDND